MLLPKPGKLTRGHHAALPYADMPTFMAGLRARPALAALALELAVLTATRTSEVLNARWTEFDLDAGLWTIPPERMKARRDHRVPLSKPALAIIKQLWAARSSEFVFPDQKLGKPVSNMSMLMLLERMGRRGATTAHAQRFRIGRPKSALFIRASRNGAGARSAIKLRPLTAGAMRSKNAGR